MANLSIRKLDDNTYKNLCEQARFHGISMEEEARRIITLAVAPKTPNIIEVFLKNFGAQNGVDLDLPTRGKPHKPIQFS